jgi:hypothetical protein
MYQNDDTQMQWTRAGLTTGQPSTVISSAFGFRIQKIKTQILLEFQIDNKVSIEATN